MSMLYVGCLGKQTPECHGGRIARAAVAGILAAGAFSCTKAPESEDAAAETEPSGAHGMPNVILILADDMGYGDISGLNRDSKIRTSNLDALCSSGIVFNNAHASSSMSTPSRYSVLTGRHPWRTSLKQGVLTSEAPAMIAPGRRTLGDLFSDSGYATACIGKWHLGWGWQKNGGEIDYEAPIKDGPTGRGFDYFYGITASLDMPPYVYIENDRVTQVPTRTLPARTGVQLMREGAASEEFVPEEVFPRMTEKALEYIGRMRSSDKPYFLYLPLTAPHTPVLPSDRFRGKSGIGDYGDFVLMIDDMVGQIVSKLKETGQYDNTIMIFTADNGCAPYVETKKMEKAGHYPSYVWRGYKSDIFEGGHRIPLIISWGSRIAGRRSVDPVCLSDFFATFAQMLGEPVANGEAEDSFSFWDVVTGSGKGRRTDIVVTSNDGSFAMTRGNLKVIFTATSGGWGDPASGSDVSGLPEMQVYNISSDVKESANLYGMPEYDATVETCKAAMKDYVELGRSTPGTPVANDTGNSWKQTAPFTD